MSITATEVAAGARMRYTPQGGQIIRRFAVEGLDPRFPDNVTRAVAYLPGDAQYQQPHPTVIGFYCMGYEATPMGNPESPNKSGAWVDVVYGTPDFLPNSTLIEIGGVNGTRSLNKWSYGPLKGQPIFVGLNNNPDSTTTFDSQIPVSYVLSNPNGKNGIIFDTAEVPVMSNASVLIFTRRENNPPLINAYRGHVNSDFWQGLRAGAWLCTQINARNIVSAGPVFPGGGYEVRYEFRTCEDLDLPDPLFGHKRVEYFKDVHTGKPVIGIDPTDGSNDGYTVVAPYPPVAFSALGLPSVY